MGLDYCPWQHAEKLGLTVEERRLPSRRRGEYLHREHLILLAPGLTHREARSTLAHEIQHALAGDIPTAFGPLQRKQEILARRNCAALLVDIDEYAAVERVRDGHLRSMAHDLDVTLRVLQDWRTYCVIAVPS
jgi:Zn-dependent peptidase ImmA (M78 family)